MDRDTAITIAITTIVLTLIGGWFLGAPSTPASQDAATFATEDVRYKYQQAELKNPKKKKAPPPDTSPAPEPSAHEAPENDESATNDSANDESAEEPPIE